MKEKRQLMKARDSSHERVYPCSKCGMPFKSVRLYLMHYQLHQQEDKKTGRQESLRCSICKRSFTSKETLDKHRQLHTNSFYQFRNGFSTSSLREILHRSKKNFVKQLPLSLCRPSASASDIPLTQEERALANSLKCSKHDTSALPQPSDLQITSEKIPVDYASFAVSKNSNEFSPAVLKNARQYIKAVSRRRKEDTVKRIIQNKSVKDPVQHSSHTIGVDVELERSEESMPIVGVEGDRYFYQCKHCSKRFYNKFHHREHFNIHSGETPYECEFCSKRFAQRSGWNRHIKLHHKYEVFEGPIPYSHMAGQSEGGDGQPKQKRPKTDELSTIVNNSFAPTMAHLNPVAFSQKGATRFIPIAPYPQPIRTASGSTPFPAGAVPLSPAILSPDRFPNGLENALPAGTFLIHATSGNTPVMSAHQGGTIHFMQPNKPPISAVFVQPSTNLQPQQQNQHQQQQQQQEYDQTPTISVSNPISLSTVRVATTSNHPSSNSQVVVDEPPGGIPITIYQQKNTNTSNSSSSSNSNQVDQQEEKVRFQCKKVKTMEDRVIFMVRVIDLVLNKQQQQQKPNQQELPETKQEPQEASEPSAGSEIDSSEKKSELVEKKSDFAYVLDPVGKVESRIFVSDHQGGNWTDFPLDEVANTIMLSRIRTYDDMNKRGPKPRHLTNNMLPTDFALKKVYEEAIQLGKEKLEEALIKQNKVVEARGDDHGNGEGRGTTASSDTSKQPLATHGRSFRSGREKRFSCNVCSRKFLAQAHLNDHMLIHTGEFPFKCMFCSRPFRHKSGLNSHHKRHIQNGVFDRPISCKDPVKVMKKKQQRLQQMMREQQNSNAGQLRQQHPQQMSADSLKIALGLMIGDEPQGQQGQQQDSIQGFGGVGSTTKSKRKGRPPRRKETSPPQQPAYASGASSPLIRIDPTMYKVKEEEEDDNDGRYMLTNKNRETVSFDVQDMFECNFCGLTFPMRTAYLKHVSIVHRNPPATSSTGTSNVNSMTSSLNSGDSMVNDTGGGEVGGDTLMMNDVDSELSDSTRYIDEHHQMSEFENTLLDMASPTSPTDSADDNDDDASMISKLEPPVMATTVGNEGLIPAHQIKEEIPDY